MKVLKGTEYTQARLAGIMHETYVQATGKVPPPQNITQYGTGSIITIDEEVEGETVTNYGLVLDETSEYFVHFPLVHVNRLVDYVVEVTGEV